MDHHPQDQGVDDKVELSIALAEEEQATCENLQAAGTTLLSEVAPVDDGFIEKGGPQGVQRFAEATGYLSLVVTPRKWMAYPGKE